MSIDTIATLVIGVLAAIYVGGMARKSIRRLLAPTRGQSACGGCSGCGTPKGHAQSEDSCGVRSSKLVVLGEKSPSNPPKSDALA